MTIAVAPSADAWASDTAGAVRLSSGESRVWAHLLEATGRVWAATVALGQGDALVELRDRRRPYPLVGACRTVADCEVALQVLENTAAEGGSGETSGVVLPRPVAATSDSWRALAARYPAAAPTVSPALPSVSPPLPPARTAAHAPLSHRLQPAPPPASVPTPDRAAVARLRAVAGLSQRGLARRLGVTRSALAEAERGRRYGPAARVLLLRATAWLRAHGHAPVAPETAGG